ncbi:hypothetical protein DUNSADRAFT_4735 [Dunaliella salina]|uniref:EF-hand domain-containing protein n=1 Tax=Dunaliella salina TaxID=3046 RepID=A0ABQ7GRE6_DUNSA|nr:hypothetical protein DUNSADRAFT_4735 [Dunaliella salina]|eukprot:KAF5837175.1 hypothetical protein DUNSADRAFT_4735 [Dunaliella salina]
MPLSFSVPHHLPFQVDKAVDRILAEVDKDGDGRVCYAEFCDMLRHQPDPPELSHDPNVAAAAHAAPAGQWGAWAERTESGRLQLAVPPESRYPTRAASLASSRNVSSKDRDSRSKSQFSSGANSYQTRNSSNGEGISAQPAGSPNPHVLSNVLSSLHSTRAHSLQTTPETNNSSRTRASSNK